MDMDDFGLCLKELKLLGVDDTIGTKPAALPGFLEVIGVTIERPDQDPAWLLIKVDGEEIVEVVVMRKKSPRKMTPEAFFQEVRSSAYDGNGAVVT